MPTMTPVQLLYIKRFLILSCIAIIVFVLNDDLDLIRRVCTARVTSLSAKEYDEFGLKLLVGDCTSWTEEINASAVTVFIAFIVGGLTIWSLKDNR